MNFIGEPYFTSIIGFEPKHFKGIIMGVGLFFIITMSSSINGLGSSGIAHTRNYLGGSLGWIVTSLNETVNTPFL